MVGRTLEQSGRAPGGLAAGPEILRVEGFNSPGRFTDVGFSLRAGEVLGLAGLVGAGRSEIAQALFGLDSAARGRVSIAGEPCVIDEPRTALRLGLGLVPEDRKQQGLVLSLSGLVNTTLPFLEKLARGTFVRERAERALVREQFEALRVKIPHLDFPVAGLSGGNQQKIVLARWLAARCRVLILDEPTRGVDVGAKAEIRALIEQLASSGAGVLLISSELPELLSLSSRILVLRGGRLVGEVPGATATEEMVMRLMAGVQEPSPPPASSFSIH
jgi:ABC-type sugar transport system ATPase subunit